MLKDLTYFFYLLGNKKRQFLFLIVLFSLNSFLDTLGLGLIGPFMALASNSGLVQSHRWLNSVYQRSGVDSPNQFTALIGLVIIGVFCLKLVLSYYNFRYIYTFSYKHLADLQKRLLRAYLSVPYTFHLQNNTALLIQIITEETQRFCNNVFLPVLLAITNGILILLLVSLLALTNLIATVSIAGLILLVFVFYLQFRHRLFLWGKEASEAGTEVIRIVNHSIGGIKETRVIGCESYFEAQLETQVKRRSAAFSAFMTFNQVPRLVLEAALMLFLVGLISLTLIQQGNVNQIIPTLTVFGLASIRLLPSVSHFITAFGLIKNSSYSLQTLYLNLKEVEAATLKPEKLQVSPQILQSGSPTSSTIPFQNSIELKNVTYKYPAVEQPALKQISLKVLKGQSIALIGKSGAGKTTLVDLILGLLIPESGDICVDEQSIYSNLRAWQNLIGYIPQSIFLIDDTLERNIAFGVPDELIDYERLERAIRSAQLEELIKQLPDGWKTHVGERGVRLSGGQRQRVGIARALYHEREVLVLDEATAALDNETERLVTDAIQTLSGTKTLIIIAHRLTTVKNCDRIYLMEKGEIVKMVSYAEVIAE
ncbi:ABC transporter ATP-binding protein [Phormidium sp. LEGE 05292]|nr:ABC transporter ATP-binding protein [Phormidium sp. LEGE 05292]